MDWRRVEATYIGLDLSASASPTASPWPYWFAEKIRRQPPSHIRDARSYIDDYIVYALLHKSPVSQAYALLLPAIQSPPLFPDLQDVASPRLPSPASTSDLSAVLCTPGSRFHSLHNIQPIPVIQAVLSLDFWMVMTGRGDFFVVSCSSAVDPPALVCLRTCCEPRTAPIPQRFLALEGQYCTFRATVRSMTSQSSLNASYLLVFHSNSIPIR